MRVFTVIMTAKFWQCAFRETNFEILWQKQVFKNPRKHFGIKCISSY